MMPEFSDFPQTLIISCNDFFHNACLKLFIDPFIQGGTKVTVVHMENNRMINN